MIIADWVTKLSGENKNLVLIDRERCKGCELCVVVCPQQNLSLSIALNRNGYHPASFSYHGKKGDCTACGICYWTCPDSAIEVRSLKT